MLFGEIVIVALQSIRANLFRAILTMLGIIIGVGAVITMLAAGAGAQKRIDEQIASLGANILTVNTSTFFAGGISRDRQSLTIDDADALRTDGHYLAAVVPEMQARGQLPEHVGAGKQEEQGQRERCPEFRGHARASRCSPTPPTGAPAATKPDIAGRSSTITGTATPPP